MRIIAGQLKGLQLKGPPGHGTRSTSDLIRGVLFQILENEATDWSRVLDIFAGTGALGLEALSRGAEHVDFVESNPSACATIRANLGRASAADRCKVYCCTAQKSLSILPGEYGIILADPPYGMSDIDPFLVRVSTSAWVGPETILVVEHSSRVQVSPELGSLRLIKDRCHGDTCVSFFKAGTTGASS